MGRGGFGGRGGRGGGRGGFSPGGGGGGGGGAGRGMGRGGGFEGGRFEDHTTYAVPAEKCGLVIGKGMSKYQKIN